MLCKCGVDSNEGSKFCSNCGNAFGKKEIEIPNMVTIKEAHEAIFNKKVSLSKIYDLVRTRNLPHVNADGKLLLDVDVTIQWWKKKLKESTKPVEIKGLRKII